MKTKTLKEAELRYGKIINGEWNDESKWMGLLEVPHSIGIGWKNSLTGKPTYRIYCNKDMYEPLLQALEYVSKRGLISELKTYNGCFCIRPVRGHKSLSAHSFGLAIDINAKTNGLGEEPTLSESFIQCFIDAGFTWGGNFKRKDPMHFQYAQW